MCVSAVACSGSVQALSVDPVNHFHTGRYKLTIYSTHVQLKVLVILHTQYCSGKTIVQPLLFLELDDTFNV